MIGIGIALALLVQTVDPAPPGLSPEIQSLISPVLEAIETEQARQAALPPPAGVTEKFARMYRLDQESRNALTPIDLSGLSPSDRQTANRAIWEAIGAVDAANEAALLEMLPPEGWFYKSVYGEGPATTAFLIVQHAGPDLQRRILPVLEPLVAKGEVEGSSYGLMYDRLAVDEGRPQRYGTQVICRGGRWVIDYDNLEDPDRADERRAAMGFPWTLQEYEAIFADYPPCSET
jgi:hypothetical protein